MGTTVCNVSDRMDPFMELDIRSTKRLAYTYQAFVDYKIDQSLLGRFIDNQDFKRFIAASSNKTALRQVTFTTQLSMSAGLCKKASSMHTSGL